MKDCPGPLGHSCVQLGIRGGGLPYGKVVDVRRLAYGVHDETPLFLAGNPKTLTPGPRTPPTDPLYGPPPKI